MKKVLILGHHPLEECLVQQYESMGLVVDRRQELSADGIDMNAYDELCLLTSCKEEIKNDEAVVLLSQLASGYDMAHHEGRKLRCHLLLQSDTVLRTLRTTDFSDEIRSQVDVYPFTMDEVWSRCIVPDYEPITFQTQKTVHVVVFGMGDMAEMVAMNIAQVAHYPNFIRDTKLRTRITLVDEEAEVKSRQWTKRYRQLFDNSYYRIVKLSGEKMVTSCHCPDYLAQGWTDFVDVEWEFVEATMSAPQIHEKLRWWGSNQTEQVLTVVFCYQDGNRNLCESLLLPQELYETAIPIYVYLRNDNMLQCIKDGNRFDNIQLFGMENQGYDVRLPLVQMAKTVKYVYDHCYHENDCHWTGRLRFVTRIDSDIREQLWQDEQQEMRMSSIYNAMNVATKMRSVGLSVDDWDKFYDIPQDDVELLAKVEHNRWCMEHLIMGWRPCNAEELQAVEADVRKKEELKKSKIHFDLRPYQDLRSDITGKPVAIYDLCLCFCLPLIAKSFGDESRANALGNSRMDCTKNIEDEDNEL